MPKTQTGGALSANTFTIDASKKSWQPPLGRTLVEIHDYAARERSQLFVDEHDVPYITLTDVTERWRDLERATPGMAEEALRIADAVDAGERVFNLTLDNRFGQTATESELHRWGWFLANAMAVSAGYTSHGQNSRRINRHGVSH